jgi:L-alanine-DL-glutamate epimerase-like enolase superfamily enzyme
LAGQSIRSPIPVYAGGGYYYPENDIERLSDEVRMLLDLGYLNVKIKIGGRLLQEDLSRIQAVLALLPSGVQLAVDAMNSYGPTAAAEVATALKPYDLRWFEDFCDPLDFETHAEIGRSYDGPLGVGEAFFSATGARNLIR